MKGERRQENATADPRWTARFHSLCEDLETAPDNRRREEARTRLWVLLNEIFLSRMRRYAQHYGGVDAEDLLDLVSEQSFAVFTRLESGRLDLRGRTGPQLVAYLSTAAHQSLLQLFRRAGRRTVSLEDADPPVAAEQSAEMHVESREFSQALQACASKLKRRARTIWFFRVFYGMSSREIAVHPEVDLKPSHVDVVLHRARRMVKECMHRSGHAVNEIPPGTVTHLWRAFRLGQQPSTS